MTTESELVLTEADLLEASDDGQKSAGSPPARGRWREVLRLVAKSWSGRIGGVLAILIIGMAVFAPLIAPSDPNQVLLSSENNEVKLEKPCVHWFGCDDGEVQHLMGLDENGRDEFSRVVYGARASLIAGALSVALAVLVGASIGLISGFYGGRTDNIIMRCMDVLLSFPSLLLAILIVSVLGRGIINSILAIAIVSVPAYARVVRGQVLAIREQDFVTADRALGVRNRRIMLHRVFPNTITPLVVQSTLGFATAVLEIAGLGFLGLGVQPPTPEWGTMIASARGLTFTSPHLVFFPGLFIFLNVLAFNLLGDALRDALDPRSAGRK